MWRQQFDRAFSYQSDALIWNRTSFFDERAVRALKEKAAYAREFQTSGISSDECAIRALFEFFEAYHEQYRNEPAALVDFMAIAKRYSETFFEARSGKIYHAEGVWDYPSAPDVLRKYYKLYLDYMVELKKLNFKEIDASVGEFFRFELAFDDFDTFPKNLRTVLNQISKRVDCVTIHRAKSIPLEEIMICVGFLRRSRLLVPRWEQNNFPVCYSIIDYFKMDNEQRHTYDTC